MFKTTQAFCRKPSSWKVTLTNQGQAEFRGIVGDSPLLSWRFLVNLPEQEGRTQRELCEQVRRSSIAEIARQCEKDGLAVSLDRLAFLDDYDALKCSHRYEECRM